MTLTRNKLRYAHALTLVVYTLWLSAFCSVFPSSFNNRDELELVAMLTAVYTGEERHTGTLSLKPLSTDNLATTFRLRQPPNDI